VSDHYRLLLIPCWTVSNVSRHPTGLWVADVVSDDYRMLW